MDEIPESLPVATPAQVSELVDDDVLDSLFAGIGELEIEGNDTRRRAATPVARDLFETETGRGEAHTGGIGRDVGVNELFELLVGNKTNAGRSGSRGLLATLRDPARLFGDKAVDEEAGI